MMVVYDVCSLYSLYIIGYYKLDTWILTLQRIHGCKWEYISNRQSPKCYIYQYCPK